jgi:hypothetical protein
MVQEHCELVQDCYANSIPQAETHITEVILLESLLELVRCSTKESGNFGDKVDERGIVSLHVNYYG